MICSCQESKQKESPQNRETGVGTPNPDSEKDSPSGKTDDKCRIMYSTASKPATELLPSEWSNAVKRRIHEAKIGSGLKHQTYLVLGRDLDKSQTRSSWGRRPLLAEQLEYAALDAVVLVYILEKLHVEIVNMSDTKLCPTDNGFNVDDLPKLGLTPAELQVIP
eukprot:Filipodium_phascolosomae@DN534_c0_g1_i2.p2